MSHSEHKDILIENLRTAIEKKKLSPERAAAFIDVNFRTIYRWLAYESRPTKLSRKAIRLGIQRIERL